VIQSKVQKFDPVWPNGPVCFAVNPGFPDQRQISDVLSLCGSQQQPSRQVQIGQATGHKNPVGILVQPAVTHLAKTEDSLDHQERMFHLRSHLRLGPVLRSICIRQWARAVTFLIGKVLGPGGMLGYMFWAAETPSARKNYVPTTPPNSCEGGMGEAAAVFELPIPMEALRQD
jgi:hypothetical protein